MASSRAINTAAPARRASDVFASSEQQQQNTKIAADGGEYRHEMISAATESYRAVFPGDAAAASRHDSWR